MLRADGTPAWTAPYPAGTVKAIALAPSGLVAQLAGIRGGPEAGRRSGHASPCLQAPR